MTEREAEELLRRMAEEDPRRTVFLLEENEAGELVSLGSVRPSAPTSGVIAVQFRDAGASPRRREPPSVPEGGTAEAYERVAVREIRRLAAGGATPAQVAKELTAESFQRPTGGRKWTASMVKKTASANGVAWSQASRVARAPKQPRREAGAEAGPKGRVGRIQHF